MHAIHIILLLSTCVATTTVEWECSNLSKCRCTKGGLERARECLLCSNITLEEFLNLQCNNNISSLAIYDFIFSNVSVQQRFATIKCTVDRISFRNASISTFSWKWMPESLTKLFISSLTVQQSYNQVIMHSDGDFREKCNMDHLKAMKIFTINGWQISNIPHCIPSSVEILKFVSIDLEEAAKMWDTQRQWPASLTMLQLQNNSISTISQNFLASLPKNLTKFFIYDQMRLNETNFILYLPTSTLRSLALSHLTIVDIPHSHFKSLAEDNVLESLGIHHTLLKHIPYKLPVSLLTLRLNNNKISELRVESLTYLKRLKFLDLSRNLIETVPKAFPESLEQLYLGNNNIKTLSTEAFTELSKLRVLFIQENRLESMPQGIQPGIHSYRIDSNLITDIGPPRYYDFCSTCGMFSIERNPWDCNENMVKFMAWNKDMRNNPAISAIKHTAICKDGFPGLHDQTLDEVMNEVLKYDRLDCNYTITHLKCDNNGMETMPELSQDLHDIQIINNKAIGVIPKNAFDGMSLLKKLQLQNIGLLRIPTGLPESIIYLNLAFNQIKDISIEVQKAFQKLKALKYLDIQYNKLYTFPVRTVRSLHQLQWVHLKGNPLNCECDLWPFVNWVNNKTMTSESNITGFFGQCSSPLSQKGADVRVLSTYFKHEKVCVPPNCGWDGASPVINCSYAMQDKLLDIPPEVNNIPSIPISPYWKTIDLSSLRLQVADINLTHLKELETVIFFNNSMDTIPIKGLPKSVTIIDIRNNNISKLPQRDDLQKHLEGIDCIDLRNNKIQTISEEDVGYFQHLSSVKLAGNPLICDCKTRPLVSWISANHDIPSTKDHDFKNLLCYGPDEVKGKLIATLQDGDYCPSIKISAVIGGLVAGVMVLVVIFFCGLGYYRKRGKIKEREAILQGFRDLLQQEAEYKDTDPETGITNNSRIKYDAFLSYSADDEDADFAAMLSDELEIKHSYKLCIHERDFLPGMGIADNIVECIGASKRIILILSQNFLSSPWCQYEVQIALTELHQKRKSKLLIPILLEELDENVEGSVKTFLTLIKAIKIPDNNSHTSWAGFWQELLCAMPDDRILGDVG